MKMNSKDVDQYIAQAPSWARTSLKELRRAIRTAAPEARESISYHIPYYSHHGRLAYYAVFKSHCSFFWLKPSDKKAFAKELASQKVKGSTLQIPAGSKVPSMLIRKVVRLRMKHNEENANIRGGK